MIGRSVGFLTTCCALALGVQAFLVPPGADFSASGDDHASISDLLISTVDPTERLLLVPCSSCVFPAKPEGRIEESDEEGSDDDDLFWIQGGANNIYLNFSTSADMRSLLLNDMDIFPGSSSHDFDGWYVEQVPSSASLEDVRSGKAVGTKLERPGVGVGILEQEKFADGNERLLVGVNILYLEQQAMTIGELRVMLFKLESGELMIMDVAQPEPFPTDFEDLLPEEPFPEDMPPMDHDWPPFHQSHGPPSSPPDHEQDDCGMLPGPLCRLKHHWGSKEGWRRPGCAGRKGGPPHKLPGHIKGPVFPVDDAEPGSHFEHGHHHHGHHHGPDGPWEQPPEHTFMFDFLEGLVTVLIPVIAGVAVGMVVSLVGLLAGRFISWAWIKFARGGRRGYASLAQTETDDADGSEKKALACEDAPPPSYEHVRA